MERARQPMKVARIAHIVERGEYAKRVMEACSDVSRQTLVVWLQIIVRYWGFVEQLRVPLIVLLTTAAARQVSLVKSVVNVAKKMGNV
jgi:Flp pilus assembly secretin CpaC